MDLTAKTPDQLRTLMANAQKVLERQPGSKQAADQVQACAAELARRGRARAGDVAHLRWTADAVDEALKPFIEISRAVPKNERTPHTRAGGARRTGEVWVDTYSAIKAGGLNYIIVCYIEKPGDEPIFVISNEGSGQRGSSWRDLVAKAEGKFPPEELPAALEMWRKIAARAKEAAV